MTRHHQGITRASPGAHTIRISSHGVPGESDVQDEEEEAAEEIMNDPEQQDLTGVPSQKLYNLWKGSFIFLKNFTGFRTAECEEFIQHSTMLPSEMS